MFIDIFSSKISSSLELKKLTSDDHDLIALVVQWAHEKWHYLATLRTRPDTEKMIRELIAQSIGFYMIFYHDHPVGMFSLESWKDKKIIPQFKYLRSSAELDNVYIDVQFRGLGFGGEIVNFAKLAAKEAGCKLMVFNTLTPSLNRFYEKRGAHVVCEERHELFPSEKLLMSL